MSEDPGEDTVDEEQNLSRITGLHGDGGTQILWLGQIDSYHVCRLLPHDGYIYIYIYIYIYVCNLGYLYGNK